MFHADRHAGRGMVRRVEVIEVDDKGESQIVTMKGLADEIFKISMRGQGHGLTGVPRVGAIGHLFLAGGRPDQAFVLNLEHPDDRIKGKDPGATTIYSSGGKNVEIRSPAGGEVHINPPG
ncbi:Mu-like prophage protein GP45-like protein [Hyphomicrobium denitrificans ATCC 51888]|uniref:Mu-like prophage protein GP45-like protein n=1 Tax=Hyphomicrobium denitrificans (strain ATCC 51888 / DSM 1869 / NCIMB 11706 / TK 0415) TaxID=582899 RepID=D8JWD2_HYPDA|nr:phage baseplate assembly protein [Hyphomicrobium denitrificans]ADJ23045.1 Mu-like prophage protein GP45-like protein [Hyphomicrobium denitrificans ATCC 51888]